MAIDCDRRALACMEANRERLGADGLSIRRARLPEGLGRATARQAVFDLAFVDPPYDAGGIEDLLVAVAGQMAVGGEVVLEHSSRRRSPSTAGPLRPTGGKRYGDSALTFYG